MMKPNVKLLLFAALFAFGSCSDSTPDDSKEMAEEQNEQKFEDTKLEKDSDFAVAAANGGMTEVELSKLAATNAASPAVKEFAAMLVTDHSAVNEELKNAAAQKNISLPATISDEMQKDVNNMAEKKGKDFDQAYINKMIDDHEKTINLFQKEATDGNDADLKMWAGNKVSVLQAHLDKAKTIHDAIK
jgi:putative membrane protein